MNGKMRTVGIALLVAFSCAVVLMVSSCAKPGITGKAENMVDSMAKGDFKAATADFNSTMLSAMPAEKLGQVWASLAPQLGTFKSRTGTREAEEAGYKTVYVTCQFEKQALDMKIVFDGADKVGGLWFVPAHSAPGGK